MSEDQDLNLSVSSQRQDLVTINDLFTVLASVLFRRCLVRPPENQELSSLVAFYSKARSRFEADPTMIPPCLSLIGAVGAALTLGLRGAGVLVTLLVLPLYVPVLICGALAVERSAGGLSPAPGLMVLGALSLGAIALAPWAIGAALRISIE